MPLLNEVFEEAKCVEDMKKVKVDDQATIIDL